MVFNVARKLSTTAGKSPKGVVDVQWDDVASPMANPPQVNIQHVRFQIDGKPKKLRGKQSWFGDLIDFY